MARKCNTCQHIKRVEIDRRLAAGEPSSQIADDYHLTPSSLHRHRANCLKLSSSNAIMKQHARGTAALALMPSKNELGNSYGDLLNRIDQIVEQAQQQGSLKIALSGLNSVRQTLDSLSKLAAADQIKPAVQTHTDVDLAGVTSRILDAFDREPEVRARIAQTLLEADDDKPQ